MGSAQVKSLQRGIVLVVLLVAAHIPFLVPYFKQLWELDHYQFYPFAIIGLAWLVRERLDVQRFQWTYRSTLLLVADITLVGLGAFAMSPWPVMAGLVCACGGVLLACRDQTSSSSLFYLALLPLMVLRLPLNLDLRLINWLQTITTQTTSSILNQLNYTHFRSGNVIEFANKSLMIEEACSGVQSLFTVLFLAAVIICLRRRSFFPAIGLFCWGIFWATSMNIVRVTGLAIAWRSFGIDLTAGWSHTAWGYVVLLTTIILMLSTDRLIDGMTSFVPDPRTESERFRNPVTSIWNWIFKVHLPMSTANLEKKRQQPLHLPPKFLRSIPVVAVIAAVLFAAQTSQAVVNSRSSASPLTLSSSLELFKATDLPPKLNTWVQSGYTTDTRSQSSSFGQYSNTWNYKFGDQAAHISCDHLFRGWHHLEVCYRGIGWEIESRRVIDGDPSESGESWPIVEVEFSRPSGERSLLLYSFFDAAGKPVLPPEASTSAALIDRIMRRSAVQFRGMTSATYQTQVFLELPGTMTQTERERIHKTHQDTREILRVVYESQR